MKKIGLFYSHSTVKTAQIARNLLQYLTDEEGEAEIRAEVWVDDFIKFNYFILGIATWFDGELPVHWDEIIPKINTIKFRGKKVAIFGLGDQKNYPDNFVDGIGLLAKVFEEIGAQIVGYTSTEGYTYGHSVAERDGQFCGLAIDFENQSRKSNERVKSWVEQLRREFV